VAKAKKKKVRTLHQDGMSATWTDAFFLSSSTR